MFLASDDRFRRLRLISHLLRFIHLIAVNQGMQRHGGAHRHHE